MATNKEMQKKAAGKDSIERKAAETTGGRKKTNVKRDAARTSVEPATKRRWSGRTESRAKRETSPGQSGSLQGLSTIASADSESIHELLEEGNTFEADAVKGVEDADSDGMREVHTHEVPEDDVPGEYFDDK